MAPPKYWVLQNLVYSHSKTVKVATDCGLFGRQTHGALQCSCYFSQGHQRAVGRCLWQTLQGDPTSQSYRQSILNIHWKDWCYNSNGLATWCEDLTHWKRPWCWERLKAGGEVDDRGWDGWMASLTRWTWVWASSRSWWWTGKPGVLQSMELQRVRHNWVTEHQQK